MAFTSLLECHETTNNSRHLKHAHNGYTLYPNFTRRRVFVGTSFAFLSPQAIIAFAAITIVAVSGAAAAAVRPPNVDLLAPLGTKSALPSPAASKVTAGGGSNHSGFSSDSILRFEQSSNVDGTYQYAYETDTGIRVEEQGSQKNIDENTSILGVTGSYEYAAPDGTIIRVTYVADENGFQPTGDHLPVAPPVPEAIQRALRYIQEHSAAQ